MINIGQIPIGRGFQPFIIAEMSGNHNQSLERALTILECAAKAGAHAIKLQTFTADTMTLNMDEGDFFISDQNSLWRNQSFYSLYEKAQTPWDWHKPIFERARELGIIAFSSPFDETAVDFLETLEVPCYKIASFENTDIRLIRKVAATGKPLIISTGMASVAELEETVDTARKAGCVDLILLKCTSSYPASPENSNLQTIPHMRDLFDCEVGLSDHTQGVGVSVAAVALGATVIEKHLTFDRTDGGVDSAFSLEPSEFSSLVEETKRAWQGLGKIFYGPTQAEMNAVTRRRSLYVIQDLPAGAILTRQNMRCIRPGHGLAPKYYDSLLGKSLKFDVKRGTPLSWDHIY